MSSSPGRPRLLCADVESGMPPLTRRVTGRDTTLRIFAAGDACAGDRLLPVRMNGVTGFGRSYQC